MNQLIVIIIFLSKNNNEESIKNNSIIIKNLIFDNFNQISEKNNDFIPNLLDSFIAPFELNDENDEEKNEVILKIKFRSSAKHISKYQQFQILKIQILKKLYVQN
jgi:hypothetical protein